MKRSSKHSIALSKNNSQRGAFVAAAGGMLSLMILFTIIGFDLPQLFESVATVQDFAAQTRIELMDRDYLSRDPGIGRVGETQRRASGVRDPVGEARLLATRCGQINGATREALMARVANNLLSERTVDRLRRAFTCRDDAGMRTLARQERSVRVQVRTTAAGRRRAIIEEFLPPLGRRIPIIPITITPQIRNEIPAPIQQNQAGKMRPV
jgi:hypothetical protein